MSRGAILTEPEAVQSYGFFDPERLLEENDLGDNPDKDGCLLPSAPTLDWKRAQVRVRQSSRAERRLKEFLFLSSRLPKSLTLVSWYSRITS